MRRLLLILPILASQWATFSALGEFTDSTFNLYRFCHNNSAQFYDPDGRAIYEMEEAYLVGTDIRMLPGPLPYLTADTWVEQIAAQTHNAFSVATNIAMGAIQDAWDNPDPLAFALGVASVPTMSGRAAFTPCAGKAIPKATQLAGKTRIGYHATKPQYATSIRKAGFRTGSSPGRLGSGGVYVNNSRAGAVAEFSHRNPGVPPKVLRVRYRPGIEAITDVPPRGYIDHIPLNVDSISAPSIRLPSSLNTIIFNHNMIEVLP